MTLNWNNIRIHNGSQDQGFEELCCQLYRSERPAGAVAFERRGYRDAGLECAHLFNDGSLYGLQAKFFQRAPSSEEWGQVDKSVRTAINKNPGLKSLTICIPQNFDDPKIPGQTSAMDKWKSHKSNWEKYAKTLGREIDFALWDDSQLMKMLTLPSNRGRLWYFFQQKEFTPDWFRHRVEEVAEDAKPRYTQELNVGLPIAEVFEGLGRTSSFAHRPIKQLRKLRQSLQSLTSANLPQEAVETLGLVSEVGHETVTLVCDKDFVGIDPMPLERMAELSERLNEAAHSARSSLDKLRSKETAKKRQEGDSAGSAGSSSGYSVNDGVRDTLWEIAGASLQLLEFAKSEQAEAANSAALLISGGAGAGKTHLLVDVAMARAARNLPSLILLGENFNLSDPFRQIMELLGIGGGLDVDDFLQALEAAAEASSGRLLLMIDAINEGAGLQLWPLRLSGFLTKLARYPRIGLAFSVRTTYEEAVVPSGASEMLVRVVHEGFATKAEEAARAFFGFYGINLPSIPLLNPEFTNPLFLKMLCKGLKEEGLHDIPEGYEGISRVFDFIVNATNNKLRKDRRLKTGAYQNPVRDYLDRLADALAASGRSVIASEEAAQISQQVYPSEGYLDSLLASLLSEGLLSSEMMREENSQPRHAVGFGYQRFGDHSVTRRLLDLHCPESPGTAFRVDGPIGCFFSRYYDIYHHKGLMEALCIQVPERFGLELPNILEFGYEEEYERDAGQRRLAECLLESLLWRRKTSITHGTFETLQSICKTQRDWDRYLEILLTLAAVPDHPLNAERIHAILVNYSLPERDEIWTIWLDENRGSEGAVDRLLAWGLLGDDKSHLSDNSVLLACVATAWLMVSTVHSIRDRATLVLVRLLTPRSHLLGPLLARFQDIDEPYVAERLYAAAYGVVMRLNDPDKVGSLAADIYTRQFADQAAMVNILVRDYARGVIERAVDIGVNLSFDPAAARPPYGSPLPGEPPSREYFEGLVQPVGEWSDRDRAVSHVVRRFGQFDVSRYAGGPSLESSGFSSIPLSETPSPSKRRLRESWERGLDAEQLELWDWLETYRHSITREHLFTFDEGGLSELSDDEPIAAKSTASNTDGEEENISGEDTDDGAEITYDDILIAFQGSLSPEQMNVYQSVATPMSMADDRQPALNQDLFARWVIQRALDLGWDADRFAPFDSRVEHARSYMSSGPWRDTIGAKYLWMAYYEILARLADNFHLLTGVLDDESVPYDGTWQTHLRTIDPSCVPAPRHPSAEDLTHFAQWPQRVYDINKTVESHQEWLQRADDFPGLEQLLIIQDPQGVEWIVLEAYPDFKQEDDDEEGKPRRNLWIHIRGYLVKKDDAEPLLDWTATQDFANRWMPEAPESHGVFLGEFYNSRAWDFRTHGDEYEYSEWATPGHDCPAPVASVAGFYSQSSEDASTTDPIRIFIPSPPLVREADLQWTGEAGEWKKGNEVVVKDFSPVTKGRPALVMRKIALKKFLQDRGYELIWIVFGEKMMTGWQHQHSNWLEISAAVRYSAGKLVQHTRVNFAGQNGKSERLV